MLLFVLTFILGAPKQPKAPKSEKAKSPEKSAVKAEAKPSAKVEAKPPQAEAYKTVSDKYESPEYYQHNRDSFADTMVTMAKYRLPQVTTSQAY